MPIIHATEEMANMHARLIQEYPDTDVILLCNGPMVYAWGSSSRLICKARGWRPKNTITISRESIDATVAALHEMGKSVGVADLDADQPGVPGGGE